MIGVGRMGLALSERLVGAGFELIGHDRRAEAAPPLRAAGGRWVADLPRLLAAADVLVTVLPGSDELTAVMERAIPALGPGMAWIDMTSAAPVVGRELVRRAERRGAMCLEATLGGGVAAARSGTLQLFVGGPAEDVAEHRSLLEALGTLEHVGGHGAGYLTKLLINLLWFTQAVALGEALLQARRQGVDLATLTAVIQRSPAASELVAQHAPALLRGDYLASFGLDGCCAQLDALVEAATSAGLPCELTATVRDAYRDTLARYGPIEGELLAVARLEERAGIALRAGSAAAQPRLTG